MKQKPKVFTIGGATFDIFVRAEEQSIMTIETPESRHKWLSFPHGAKVQVKAVHETFGGGATNTAVTFAGMGFEVCFVGMVGEKYGEKVFDNLHVRGVDCTYASQTDQDRTGFSNIINTFDGDRTLLYYAGANRFFSEKELPMEALKQADWIFLSHLAQPKSRIPQRLRSLLASNSRIKLAWNPGHEQIEEGIKKWKTLLKHTEVIFLNKEEASVFTGVPYELAASKQDDPQKRECYDCLLPPYADDCSGPLKAMVKAGATLAVVTDGRNGAQAFDGKNWYFCPVLSRKRVDTLGAGDAYASGFTSALIQGLPLKTALLYGTINAGGVVNQPGAQNGVMTKKEIEKTLKKVNNRVKQMLMPR